MYILYDDTPSTHVHRCSYSKYNTVVPHITDAIQEWVMKQAKVSVDDDGIEPEVCVIEVRVFSVCTVNEHSQY